MPKKPRMTWEELLGHVEGLKDLPQDDRRNALRAVHEGLTQQPHRGNWVQTRARVREIITERIAEEGADAPATWDPNYGRLDSQPKIKEEPVVVPPPIPQVLPPSLSLTNVVLFRFLRDEITRQEAIDQLRRIAQIAVTAAATAALEELLKSLRKGKDFGTQTFENFDSKVEEIAREFPAKNEEEPIEVLPPDEGEEMPEKTHTVEPDAGNEQLENDLNQIVTDYKNGSEDDFPAELAREKIQARHAQFVITHKGDMNAQAESVKMATAAAGEITNIRVKRIAEEKPAPTPRPAKPTPTPEDDDVFRPAAPRGRVVRERTYEPEPVHDRHDGMLGWAFLALVAGLAIIALFVLADDRGWWPFNGDNNGTTAVNVPGGNTNNGGNVNVNGGNTGGGNGGANVNNPGGNTGGSLNNNGFGIVTKSSGNGSPNLDGVATGDCQLKINSATRMYIESEVNRICTETLSNIPAGWQATVDAVDQTVDGVRCTHCVVGYNVNNGKMTITLNNGAAMLGTPDVASGRFCQILRTSLENGWVPAENPKPLSSWAACPTQ